MKIPNLALAPFLFLSVWPPSCSNQERLPAAGERKITSLSIRNATPKYVEDRRISHLISSQPGTIYDEKKIDDDIRTLWESGLVEDVKFSVKSDGDGLHLVAEVSTRRGLGPVILTGNTRYSDQMLWKQISRTYADRISRAVDRQLDPITEKPIIHNDKDLVSDVLPAVCKELKEFYRREGFNEVRIRVESWKGGPPTARDFVFRIDENAAK